MKYEIKIRVTARETQEFETSALAVAYARQRVAKANPSVEAVLLSVIQVDPPLPDTPCPACNKTDTVFNVKQGVIPMLPAPAAEIQIDLPAPGY